MKKLLILIILTFSLSFNAWCAIDLTGDADYITGSNLYSVTQASLSFYVRVFFDTDTADQYVFSIGSTTVNGFIVLRDNVDGATSRTDAFTILVATTGATDYRLTTATNSASAGNEIILVFTYSTSSGGDDEVRAYIDGVEDANSPVTNGAGNMATPATNWRVGLSTGGSSPLNGIVREIAIWNTVISQQDVLNLSNSETRYVPSQIDTDNLLMYILLDDYSDGTALNTDADGYKDRSGNGNHGQGVDGDGDSLNEAETILSYPPG